jgi:flagellar biosynthesis/type III secretory pathway protein FliH
MSDIEKTRSEIELTRAELADSVDALHAKLSVKTIARDRADVLAERLIIGYTQAKAAAPEPVRRVAERVEALVASAATDRQQALRVGGAVLVTLLVLRRVSHR